MYKLKFILTCLLFATSATQASFVFTENCSKAYEEMFALRLANARQFIQAEKISNPSNKIPVYIESYIDFLKAFISEEDGDYEALKKSHDLHLSVIDKDDQASPYFLLTKAEIEIQLAFVKIKRKEYVSGALAMRRAFKMLEENHKKFPGFTPDLKCLGLIHAFIGAVPDNYHWLLKLAGMTGTVKQGIAELNEFVKSTVINPQFHYLNKEASLLLLFSKTHLEKDAIAAGLLADSLKKTATTPLEIFSVGNYYLHAAKNDSMLSLVQKTKYVSDYPLHYLELMEGMGRLYKLDTLSRYYYLQYIAYFKGKSFIKSAYQKVAWEALLRQDTNMYRNMMGYCKKFGDDFSDEDKQANKEAVTGEIPNVILLKSRLLFDGGYYREALNQLAGKSIKDFPKLSHQLELTYRAGRIYDMMGEKEKAISNYLSTISNGKIFPFYFAANSALNLGLIYEKAGDLLKAEQYYRECLSMRDHEYQNSIDQKARAGLNRIGASDK